MGVHQGWMDEWIVFHLMMSILWFSTHYIVLVHAMTIILCWWILLLLMYSIIFKFLTAIKVFKVHSQYVWMCGFQINHTSTDLNWIELCYRRTCIHECEWWTCFICHTWCKCVMCIQSKTQDINGMQWQSQSQSQSQYVEEGDKVVNNCRMPAATANRT